MTSLFLIPDDFRTFMKSVVVSLETPSADLALDSADAFTADCGRGGRIDGGDTYRFEYITRDNKLRWGVVLHETQIRDIADGLLIEVEAERFSLVAGHRAAHGDPLLIWGEFPDDALRASSIEELLAALDALSTGAQAEPRLVRLWTATDDQLVAVLWRECCALYVVESPEGYATSMGDATRTGSFEARDHEGHTLTVPFADCVSWDYARRALVCFVEHSELGDVPVEGRIPSLLLMMGEVDRKDALAVRPEVPTRLERTSLRKPSERGHFDDAEDITAPIEMPPPLGPLELAEWARRLLEHLHSRSLLERGPGNLDELCYQLGGLLGTHADEAEHSVETADWLANEIGALRGLGTLFATGTDLQVALRRSRGA